MGLFQSRSMQDLPRYSRKTLHRAVAVTFDAEFAALTVTRIGGGHEQARIALELRQTDQQLERNSRLAAVAR